ncbi:oxygen-independent coproporphyrinogen-3 oxidase [Lachnospiraceae bacterium]|nr:oxygen-independent coproporphyrinogen-3 oxidase [Lachnospiraceae bacterium]
MVRIEISREVFRNDLYALVKAFLPAEEISIKVVPELLEQILLDTGLFTEPGEHDAKRYAYRLFFNDERLASFLLVDVSDTERVDMKNRLKRDLYHVLSKRFEKELPWGTLNGIRPTNMAKKCLESGLSADETKEYMRSTYLVSDEKNDLAVDIAEREIRILSGFRHNGYSLYIGIPFCPTTCLYCSFTSYPIGAWASRVDQYLDCVEKEIRFTAEAFKDQTLDTIYVGGGTPTTLTPDQFERLFTCLEKELDLSHLKEFTVESGRPDSITIEKLRVMKKHGVTRLSVNPQTMKDETLKLIGRHHSVDDVRRAFVDAREVGFDNINMDMILGLPGETDDDVRNTVEEIKKLGPDDLTVHSLAIKRASRLAEVIDKMGYDCIHTTDNTMKIAEQGAKDMGLVPYYLYRQKNISGNFENTGYSRPGKEGLYNILMMEEVQSIVAIGAGTVTKRLLDDGNTVRCDTHKDVELYMNEIDEMVARKRKLFMD